MKKRGFLLAAVLITLGLAGCNTNIDQETEDLGNFGPQADGSYRIDPSTFTVWYNAAVAGDTIKFTGGGVYWLFPAGAFDIKNYGSLVVEYTTSGAAIPSGGHLEVGIKAITNQFEGISSGSGDYGTDVTYQWLPGTGGENDQLGDGSFTIDGIDFAQFQADDIIGIALQPPDPQITTFNLKIRSMTLTPASSVDEDVVDNPVFTGWGCFGPQGNGGGSPFVFMSMIVSNAGYQGALSYPFPAEADEYSRFTVTFTLTKLATGESAKPMKLTIKNAKDENWSAADVDYQDYDSDGQQTLTYDLSHFDENGISFWYNCGGSYTDSADFTIKVNQISFHN